MGTDKALLEVDGRALARRVHDALIAAGCAPVVAIGGDAPALRGLGLDVVDDLYPGDGPLGALITACTTLGEQADIVVALGCDLPDADPRAIAAVCAPFDAPGGDEIDVVVPRSADRHHMHHAAWRVTTLPTLLEAFTAGERAPRRVLARLRVHPLTVDGTFDPRWLADLDEPDELAARRSHAAHRPG
jgi:molybdopterin-guanine dinucleotide biosynthesis protein A